MKKTLWKRLFRQETRARLQAASQNPGDASAIAGLAGAEGLLGGALGRIFALSELSRPKSQSKHGQPAGRTEQHGEQGCLFPAGFQ